MKKIGLLLVLVLVTTISNAMAIEKCGIEKLKNNNNVEILSDSCDVITMKNGNEVSGKIVEIGNDVIKYKKCSNLQGPLYTINKTEVLFIKYSNGQKDVFTTQKKEVVKKDYLSFSGSFFPKFFKGNQQLPKNMFLNELNSYFKSASILSSSQTLSTIGAILQGIGFIVLWYVSLLIGALIFILGIIFAIIGKSKFEESVKVYNNHLNEQE